MSGIKQENYVRGRSPNTGVAPSHTCRHVMLGIQDNQGLEECVLLVGMEVSGGSAGKSPRNGRLGSVLGDFEF